MTIKKSVYYFAALAVLVLGFVLIQTSSASAVTETGRTNYKLAPGVTESTVYAVDSNNKNLIIHILRINKGANVSVKAGYKNYYAKNSTAASRKNAAADWSKKWKWGNVLSHTKDYESSADKKGKVIAAASMDFLGSEGRPMGKVIAEGNVLSGATNEDFLAVLNSGEFAVRAGNSDTSDVQEAVAGGAVSVSKTKRLVKGGKVACKYKANREPRQAVGVTAKNSLVIVNVDGRDPLSVGATLYDLAMIMKQQGCTEAINMDGGGSATFLTKRSSDSSVKYRSIPGDGFIRNIASSLMIVKNSKGSAGKIVGPTTVSMKKSKTGLSKDSAGRYVYKINGKRQKGLFMINGKNYLFDSKGRGVTKTITLGKAKYTFKKGLYKKSSDKKAKEVGMGYCGAGSKGANLMFAYHRGNKVMNIGLNPMVKKNGKMMNWKSNPTNLPWYAVRADIKQINIGNGVKNLGNYFMYVSKNSVFDGSKAPLSALKKINLPITLKTVGQYSLYYKPYLKNLVMPASVSSIGKKALYRSGKGYIKFTSTKPPKMGASAFTTGTFSKAIVKKTTSWKKFVKAKKFKKYGFKKKVQYSK